MDYWQGFLIGILGSFHCIGMCGPLALAIPHTRLSSSGRAFEGTTYNLGRVMTYTVLGALAGGFGATIGLAGFQESASVISGALIILAVMIPKKITNNISQSKMFLKFSEKLKQSLKNLFGSGSLRSYFGIGLLNGLLPCGLVYIALAASISVAGVVGGMAFMAAFGLGTFPVMFALYFAKSFISQKLRLTISKWIPAAVVTVGLLLILRGLSLGIPYISPKLQDKITNETECCH